MAANGVICFPEGNRYHRMPPYEETTRLRPTVPPISSQLPRDTPKGAERKACLCLTRHSLRSCRVKDGHVPCGAPLTSSLLVSNCQLFKPYCTARTSAIKCLLQCLNYGRTNHASRHPWWSSFGNDDTIFIFIYTEGLSIYFS